MAEAVPAGGEGSCQVPLRMVWAPALMILELTWRDHWGQLPSESTGKAVALATEWESMADAFSRDEGTDEALGGAIVIWTTEEWVLFDGSSDSDGVSRC